MVGGTQGQGNVCWYTLAIAAAAAAAAAAAIRGAVSVWRGMACDIRVKANIQSVVWVNFGFFCESERFSMCCVFGSL